MFKIYNLCLKTSLYLQYKVCSNKVFKTACVWHINRTYFLNRYPSHFPPPPSHNMHRPPFMRGNYHGGVMGHNPPHMMPHQPHAIRPRHHGMMPPLGAVASAYEGVAQKIGTGIIDDPLEAFNRIMREKERRKEERRAVGEGGSPIRRRSRSPDLRRRSPLDRRRSPRRSPDGRRGRSPADKRGRSTGERRSPDDRRRRRSGSFHSRASRSYSR